MTMQQGQRHQNGLRGWRRRTRATRVRLSVQWIVSFAAVIAVLETAAAHAQIAKYDVPGLDENFRPDFKDSDAYFQFPSNVRPSHQLTGPMVGHVSSHQATIWAHAGPDHDLVVRYQNTDGSGSRQVTKMVAHADRHHSATAQLQGLRESTRYEYQVFLDGKTDRAWKGWFTTAPPKGESTNFKMAFASCFGQGYQRRGLDPERLTVPTGASWYLLMAQQPAFHLLLGDNIYGNSTDYEYLWKCHMEERRINRPFASVIRQIPTYAVWDDHDYGPNNSDGLESGKEGSLQAFKAVFANPAYGTPQTPGVFFSFSWGDVDFFMLDNRYHRSPNDADNDLNKRMLGDGQFRWLAEKLTSSRAKFKVIVCGSSWTLSRTDSWRLFDFSRQRVLQAIAEHHINGVVYLSGDLHWCDLMKHKPTVPGGYPLYEIMSSALDDHSAEYKGGRKEQESVRGFATLQFDTTLADPTIRVEIIHGDATVRLEHTIRHSELQVKVD